MKTLYHATPKNNTFSIMREGIKAGIDGIVYFCETAEESLAYIYLFNSFYEYLSVTFNDYVFIKKE